MSNATVLDRVVSPDPEKQPLTRTATRRSDSTGPRGGRDRCRRTTPRPSRSRAPCITELGLITAVRMPDRVTASATSSPNPRPMMPPNRLMTNASTMNCIRMSLARAPDGLAQPDLARALGHADQHDVHDADAADDQRDRRDRGQERRQQRRDGVQDADERRLVEDPEVVFAAVCFQMVALAQQHRNAILDGLDVARHSLPRAGWSPPGSCCRRGCAR